MSKFKEDETVRIIKRGQSPPLPHLDIDTAKLIGKVGVIERADDELGYWVVVSGPDGGYDWFDEDALEAA